MLNFPNCLFSHLIFVLFCPLIVNSDNGMPHFHMPVPMPGVSPHSENGMPHFHMPMPGVSPPYQFPPTGGKPPFQMQMPDGMMMPPVAANAAEVVKLGSMQSVLENLNQATHGTNHVGNFQRKKQPQEEFALPEPPLPKVILVIWDRNGEILDDPHVQIRAVQEEHAVMQAGMLPLAHMSPLIECAHDLSVKPHEICDYDLLIGSGVVDITLRKDRHTGKNRAGLIEISYAEKKDGPRISYIESIERLAIASDPGHNQHQAHHRNDMAVTANDSEHRKILHLKYHPFESYAYVYHIHGIVFWRGADLTKIDPMPITAPDPFVHIEYFSDHEHVMNKLPYEMDLNPQTGEFRITIRNGFGLDKQREVEDKNYGKINIAVAVNKILFRMRYYRVYTVNVNECIKKSQHLENGTKHQTYSKENPAQILYLWGDKEKMRFGQFPLKVNTHAFSIRIARNGQAGCEKPFNQYTQPQNWLEIRDEDDEMTLIHATNVTPVDHNTLQVQIALQPNIAEGLHIRIDCGADASIHNIIIYQMESFEQLRISQMVQLKPAISTATIFQNDHAPNVTVFTEQHNVHQGARNPHSKMEHKRKHNGIDQIDAVLAEDGNGGGKPIRDDRCAPGLPRGRLAEECNSHLHRNGYDRLPENVAHLGHGGGQTMPQIGQTLPGMNGQFGQNGAGHFAGVPSMSHQQHAGQTFPQFAGAPNHISTQMDPNGHIPSHMNNNGHLPPHMGQNGHMPPQMGQNDHMSMVSPYSAPSSVPSSNAGHFGTHPPGQLPSPEHFGQSDQFGKMGMHAQPSFNQLLPEPEKPAHSSNLPPNRVAPAHNSLLHNPSGNAGHFGSHPSGQFPAPEHFGQSDQFGKTGMHAQPSFNQLFPEPEKPVENSHLPPNRVAPTEHSLLHNPPSNNGHNPFALDQNGQQFSSAGGEYPSGLDQSTGSGYLHPQPELHQNPFGMMNGGNQNHSQMFPHTAAQGGMSMPPHMMNAGGGGDHHNNGGHHNAGMPAGSNPHEMPHHGAHTPHGMHHPSNMPPTMMHHQQHDHPSQSQPSSNPSSAAVLPSFHGTFPGSNPALTDPFNTMFHGGMSSSEAGMAMVPPGHAFAGHHPPLQ